jgi:outer membrane lipoprotein LolB
MRILYGHRCRVAVLAVLLTAAGCAVVKPTGAPARKEQVAGLLALEEWELRGRVAVKDSTDGGQARIHWRQTGDRSQIRFTGPFGAGAYELLWEPGRVTVTDGGGEQSVEYRGADAAENFLREQLGWAFPAGSTRYWVMGLPDPAAAGNTTFDAAGLPEVIDQSGWTISFDRFANYEGYDLPTRLDMQNGDARVRMVISSWRIMPPGN